jgi:hypothetical protein
MTEMPTERQMADQLLEGDIKIENALAMGIFQYYKWDQIKAEEAKQTNKTQLDHAGIMRVADSFSTRRWEDFRFTSRQFLDKAAERKQRWLVPIVQGTISAFCYFVLLVLFLLIVSHNGIDILHAVGIEVTVKHDRPSSVAGGSQQPQ